MLLEVCAGKSQLHLIAIGTGKGIEWPIFIDALVNRPGGPPSILRITMIKNRRREEPPTTNTANTITSEAADFLTRLVEFASGLGLHVEVNVVGKELECVTREDLRLRHGEVNIVDRVKLNHVSLSIEWNEPYMRWLRRLSDKAKKVCMNLVSNHGEFSDVVFDDANSVCLCWRKESMTFTSVWATLDDCSKNSCKCSMLHN